MWKLNKEEEEKLEFFRKYVGAGAIKKSLMMIVLWMLSKEKMHGYRIMDIIKSECHMKGMLASKLYPMLNKLEKDGFIVSEKEKQGRRVKKVYSITKKGKDIMVFTKKIMGQSKFIKEFFKEMMT